MKVYDVEYGTKVRVISDQVRTPPGATRVYKGEILTIQRADGMYHTAINANAEQVYLAGFTEVEPIN